MQSSSTTPSSTTEVTTRSDTAGNLMTVTTKVNGTQTSQIDYTYSNNHFADRLSSLTIDNVTRYIQYSDYCNPLTWFNGTDYTNLTWTQGRRLSSITKGDQTYSYEYDMSGVRSVKIAEGLKHEYVTQNGRVVRDYVTNASTGAFVRCLDFFYDEAGRPFAMRSYYDSTITGYDTFHYVLNAQGDVVQLNYQGGAVYAQYSYDAWGNVLTKSGNYADLNPLRYRGYYYDTETGFYYLQSRYYDPIVRRFINADSYGSTGTGLLGYNMFAYCENSPVNGIDASGARFVNTMMTDNGGGFVPPPLVNSAANSLSCDEKEILGIVEGLIRTPLNGYGFSFKSISELKGYDLTITDCIMRAPKELKNNYSLDIISAGGATLSKMVSTKMAEGTLKIVAGKAIPFAVAAYEVYHVVFGNRHKSSGTIYEIKTCNYVQTFAAGVGFSWQYCERSIVICINSDNEVDILHDDYCYGQRFK